MFQFYIQINFYDQRENQELKKKIKQQDNKLEELENIIDNLKRKVRINLDIEMKSHLQNRQFVEKPVFIEKIVEIDRSSHNHELAQEYKEQMIRCQQDFSELQHRLVTEQDFHHQKIRECETWKNHSFQQEDKFHFEINLVKQSFDIQRNMFDQEIREKDHLVNELTIKINSLMQELENLTYKNIDKNRQIANEIIHSNSVVQINETYNQIPTYFGSTQNVNNQSLISYIH